MACVISLLGAYGLCFGLQHKVPFLHGRSVFLDNLLRCSYCVGFHCGWVMWLLVWVSQGQAPATGVGIPASILMWGLASAAWCYGVDVLTSWMEANTSGGPDE